MLQGSSYQHTAPIAIPSLIAGGRGVSLILVSGQNGTNIGVTNEIGATLTDAEIARREFGSKCLLAGWNFYVTLIWCLKGTMLCFYNRMTYAPSATHDLDMHMD